MHPIPLVPELSLLYIWLSGTMGWSICHLPKSLEISSFKPYSFLGSIYSKRKCLLWTCTLCVFKTPAVLVDGRWILAGAFTIFPSKRQILKAIHKDSSHPTRTDSYIFFSLSLNFSITQMQYIYLNEI